MKHRPGTFIKSANWWYILHFIHFFDKINYKYFGSKNLFSNEVNNSNYTLAPTTNVSLNLELWNEKSKSLLLRFPGVLAGSVFLNKKHI